MRSCRSSRMFSRHITVKLRCGRKVRCFARCPLAPHVRKVQREGRLLELSVHRSEDDITDALADDHLSTDRQHRIEPRSEQRNGLDAPGLKDSSPTEVLFKTIETVLRSPLLISGAVDAAQV